MQLLVLAGNAGVVQAQTTAELLLDEREVVSPIGIKTQAGILPFKAVTHGLRKRTAMMLVKRSDLPMRTIGDRDLSLMRLPIQRDELA